MFNQRCAVGALPVCCSVLGQGMLGALQSAAAAGLFSESVRLVPESVTVRGRLVNTLLTQRVSGFDLSPVNQYKWHPTMERIEHSRCDSASHLGGTSLYTAAAATAA